MKLLITGGHVTPALAVIDTIAQSSYRNKFEIIFVGRKYSLDGEQTLSLEYKEITRRNIKFLSLQAGRFTRVFSFKTFLQIVKIPLGFIHAFLILLNEKPQKILSFGGYIALPIALVGWILRIPVYSHEQTMSPGTANKVIAFFSRNIFYSFPDTKAFFPHKKCIFTGNPVRKSVFYVDKKPFEIQKDQQKVIYITGGSLGSHAINNHVKAILHQLLSSYIVIHQTGSVKEYNDYERLLRIRRDLPDELKKRYFLAEHIYDDEIGYIYSVSDIVVGRSGANTFFELLRLKKPAVLIPLPWSAHKEQQKQAEFFLRYKLGEIFEQKSTSEHLFLLIRKIEKNLKTYIANFNTLPFQIKQDASELIIEEILKP